jgi:hypothetical protein
MMLAAAMVVPGRAATGRGVSPGRYRPVKAGNAAGAEDAASSEGGKEDDPSPGQQ